MVAELSMTGKNRGYCNAGIHALVSGYVALTQTNISDLLRPANRYGGKADTLVLDAIPEIAIANSLREFDEDSVLVTEERGEDFGKTFPDFTGRNHSAVFVCDPTDRSDELERFVRSLAGFDGAKLGHALQKTEISAWEAIGDGPASITGSYSAISCIRRGQVIFSALLNYITHTLVVACPAGIKAFNLGDYENLKSQKIDLTRVMAEGTAISFPSIPEESSWDDAKHFVAFLGSERKKGYLENFRESDILGEVDKERFIRYKQPGGPSRPLYLSDFNPRDRVVGFVLANGEKMTEWIHWISFVRFAISKGQKELKMFEVSQSKPFTKDDTLMATSRIYSLFQQVGNCFGLDVNFLRRFPNPSRYRSTLIVAPGNNEWVNQLAQRQSYPELFFD